jgi:hypothetical protein
MHRTILLETIAYSWLTQPSSRLRVNWATVLPTDHVDSFMQFADSGSEGGAMVDLGNVLMQVLT